MKLDSPSHRPPWQVALVTTELAPGGAERCLTHLAIGLAKTGFGRRFSPQVYSLAPPPSDDRRQLVDQLEAAGVPVHFVGVNSPWRLLHARSGLTKWMKRQAPDLIQTFLFHANMMGALVKRAVGAKHLVFGVRVAEPRRGRLWIERHAARRCAKIVCVSHSVQSYLRQRGGYGAEKLIVIPNGVDVNRFAPDPTGANAADLSELAIPPGRRVLAAIGRLHRQKGIDRLVEMAPKLIARLPQHDLLIIGDGPEKERLSRRAAELQVASRVHFVGWQSDTAALLAASDLLVLPSRWEGMPNVLLEAMASARPVSAMRVEGVSEILGPLNEEQAVPPGDEKAFVEKTVRILQNRTYAKQLGTRNRLRVIEQFGLPQIIEKYANLYEELLVGRGRP